LTDRRTDTLYELADAIHALARQLAAPAALRPGPCTPVEISVMRYISRHPGTAARVAAQATRLPSSNFSRVSKSLMAKGLLRREADAHDARGVRLYPTELAQANSELMRAAWSRALAGTRADPATLELVTTTLRHIEADLVSSAHPPVREAQLDLAGSSADAR
jgi:DNA-binding MarR family transcriptional regulator